MNPPSTASAVPRIHRIAHGAWRAEIAPDVGGSLVSFYSEPRQGSRHDWLRAASEEALASRHPLGMASFPLVPWCNRIRNGRFEWNGRTIQLVPNYGDSPHTIHGLGWHRAWQVQNQSDTQIELALRHDGRGEWPFPFVATQTYALDAHGLSIAMTLRNTGNEAMPGALGHHPYLHHARDGAGTVVQAHVDSIWQGDSQQLPTGLTASHPAVDALRRGMVLRDFDLDNNFIGYRGEASVRWPDGRSLVMRSATPLDFFVLYGPADRDIFCMEAVSNCTDWPNLRDRCAPAQIGGQVIVSGGELRAWTRFEPRET